MVGKLIYKLKKKIILKFKYNTIIRYGNLKSVYGYVVLRDQIKRQKNYLCN